MYVETATAAGMTLSGSGPLVSLGIENYVSNVATVTLLYNWWTILTTVLIGVMSSNRDMRFMAVLIPIWAGFCMFSGWLVYPNQGTGFGILVVCAMIAIMNYMLEVRHERFGIAGPGSMVVKIFTFLIVLQAAVVFINQSQIFPGDTPALAVSNNQFANIDLNAQVGNINAAGGLTAQIMDVGSIILQIAASMLLLVAKVIISLALFAVILPQVFPLIGAAGAIGVAFLVAMQFAIWTMYLLFAFFLYYKPGPDPGL